MSKIDIRDVTVDYRVACPVRQLSVCFDSGSVGIMGPSGSGKSTLLRVIAGLQAPSSGTVEIDGEPVKPPSWGSAGDSRLAMIHQDYRLVPFLNVAQNLLLAAEARHLAKTSSHVTQVLERVGLSGSLARRLPGTMSGGEQQRVAIARALITDAEVILADEPTGALDVANTAIIAKILMGLGQSKGPNVVVATHDPKVAALVEQCYEMVDGQLRLRN